MGLELSILRLRLKPFIIIRLDRYKLYEPLFYIGGENQE